MQCCAASKEPLSPASVVRAIFRCEYPGGRDADAVLHRAYKYGNNQPRGNGMTTRAFAFAPLSVILIAVFLNAALSVPDASATDVAFTNFQGAWAAATTYDPGSVVTYGGASYICLVQNTHFAPVNHPNYWADLGPSSKLFGSNSVTYKSGTESATCNEGS